MGRAGIVNTATNWLFQYFWRKGCIPWIPIKNILNSEVDAIIWLIDYEIFRKTQQKSFLYSVYRIICKRVVKLYSTLLFDIRKLPDLISRLSQKLSKYNVYYWQICATEVIELLQLPAIIYTVVLTFYLGNSCPFKGG